MAQGVQVSPPLHPPSKARAVLLSHGLTVPKPGTCRASQGGMYRRKLSSVSLSLEYGGNQKPSTKPSQTSCTKVPEGPFMAVGAVLPQQISAQAQ